MPVQRGYTTKNGERVGYYRWGDEGTRYFYEPGDAEERELAREQAEAQRAAAYASGYDG
jgi:hypothetical protein